MHDLTDSSLTTAAAIGWFYLATNAMRVFTYLPQIVAVWRSTDGARAVSLFTWGSWLVCNGSAILYGAVVVHDLFFVLIALVNFCGCTSVTLIALQAAHPPVLVAHPLRSSARRPDEDGASHCKHRLAC